MCLKFILDVQLLPQNPVVVDLAIDSEGKGAVIVDKRLGAGVLRNAIYMSTIHSRLRINQNRTYQHRRYSDARGQELRHSVSPPLHMLTCTHMAA